MTAKSYKGYFLPQLEKKRNKNKYVFSTQLVLTKQNFAQVKLLWLQRLL